MNSSSSASCDRIYYVTSDIMNCDLQSEEATQKYDRHEALKYLHYNFKTGLPRFYETLLTVTMPYQN